MSNGDNTVTPISRPNSGSSGGHGGAGNGGGNYIERLAKLEATQQYLATKADVQEIKVWILRFILAGMLGGMGVAAAMAIGIAKLLFST